NPIRRNRSLTGPRVLALAGVCVTASIAALLISDRLSSSLDHTASARMLHLDSTNGCDGSGPLGANAASCTFAHPGDRGTTDPVRKEELWRSGLSTLLHELTRARIRVVVVHPVPKVPGWDVDACSPLSFALHSCNASTSRAAAERDRARALHAEDAALRTT